MENEEWDIITPGFKIHNICMITSPCQHHVIINDKKSLMGAIDICQYFIDNNLPINKHFEQYQKVIEQRKIRAKLNHLIKNNILDEFKKSINIDSDVQIKQNALSNAWFNKNFEIIKYLVEELDTPIYEYLMVHAHDFQYKTNDVDIFRYLLLKCDISITRILSEVSHYGRYEYVKLIVDEFSDKLTEKDYKDVLFRAGNFSCSLDKETQQIADLITKISIEKKIIYSGEEIRKIRRGYKVLKDNNLIYNGNCKYDVKFNYIDTKPEYKEPEICEYTKACREDSYAHELIGLCHGNLNTFTKYKVHIDNTKWYAFTKIYFKIKINNNNYDIFNSVTLSFNLGNGGCVEFTKTINNDYIEFTLCPLEPFNFIHTGFTTKHIEFNFNKLTSQDEIYIEDIYFSIDFIDDPTYIHIGDPGWADQPSKQVHVLTKNKYCMTQHGFGQIFDLDSEYRDENINSYGARDLLNKKLQKLNLPNI